MASVSLKHIYKVYPNGVKAVNDFNMDIEDKEFIVFVGPSGCGKSTTLRMIAGLEDITAGELRIGDEVVNDMEPKDRDIAMVFQNYALYPHMTVYENMAFGLKIRKVDKEEIHRRIMEAAEILSITEYLDRKPKAMSGGQRQRVALGRAILRNPKVMLLDEPLSNLDAKLRTQMRAEIAKLHDKLQTTFIYVTHDQVEAMTMGSRIVVMRNGVVQQIEKPKDLYRYPVNKFVAGFIGTPQMNFWDVTLTEEEENVKITFLNSNNEVSIPKEYFLKVKPEYIDGKRVATLGLRCENISLKEEDVNSSNALIDIKISHLEELGTETLVYGDLNIDTDSFNTTTRVIIKASGEEDFVKGSVMKAALDFRKMHIFDPETEESVLPRIPTEMALPCDIRNNSLIIENEEIALPLAIAHSDLANGKVIIPLDAITLGGNISCEVIKCEPINDIYLNYLKLGNRYLFITTDQPLLEGTNVKVNIDLKRIRVLDINNEVQIEEMPLVNHLPARFIKFKDLEVVESKGKAKAKKVIKFKFEIEGEVYDCPDTMSSKIISALDINSFDSPYTIDVTPYDLVLSKEGIAAEVTRILDYGTELFAEIMINGNTYYISTTDKNLEGNIHVTADLDKAGVTETKINMKLI